MLAWHKCPNYGFVGVQSLEGNGHRSQWCPCSGDGWAFQICQAQALTLASALILCRRSPTAGGAVWQYFLWCFPFLWVRCTLWLFNSSGSASSWTMGTDDSPNVTDDAADEIMDRIVKSATQVPSQRVVPRERKRSRANRKSCKCLGVRVTDSPFRDPPSRSLWPGKGRESEAGSSELSVVTAGPTCAC